MSFEGISSCEYPLGSWMARSSPMPKVSAQVFGASTMCDACPTGEYQNETGQNFCKRCGLGAYQDLTGQSFCQPCPNGTTTTGSLGFKKHQTSVHGSYKMPRSIHVTLPAVYDSGKASTTLHKSHSRPRRVFVLQGWFKDCGTHFNQTRGYPPWKNTTEWMALGPLQFCILVYFLAPWEGVGPCNLYKSEVSFPGMKNCSRATCTLYKEFLSHVGSMPILYTYKTIYFYRMTVPILWLSILEVTSGCTTK